MIKIFGQIRYHWQPELSWAIIYWSLATMPLFFALSLLYEKTKQPHLVFILIGISLILTIIGFHRFFLLGEKNLRIVSFNPLTRRELSIASINKVELSKYRLCLHQLDGKKSTFYMRKWPKKFFLDALAQHPDFTGEVELVDNFSRVDYFKIYKKDKKPLVKD